MISYLLILLKTGLVSVSSALQKSFQRKFENTTLNFIKYNLINSVFASCFLFTLNGFRLNANLPTFIYSALFAVIVGFDLVLAILALVKTTIPMVYIISTAGSVIISTLFEAFALDIIPSIKGISSAGLLLLAVVLSYERTKQKKSRYNLLIYLFFFINSGAVMIITKLFTLDKRVCDEKSFCLLTNIILAIVCAVILLAFFFTKRSSLKEILKPFTPKQTLNICARTALSNLDSLIVLWAVALMSLSVFSVATSAMTIISATLISFFVFKEKILPKQLVSAVLAIAAIILGI